MERMTERSVTPGQIITWARDVAGGFLQRDVPLFDGVKKVAMDNGLNHEQISRVCEAANHAVFNSTFKTNPNRLFEFPVVKGEEVIEALSMPTSKTASINTRDYDQPPPSPLSMSCDEVFDKIFPKTAGAMRSEYESAEAVSRARAEMNKVAAAEGELRSQVVGSDMRRDREEDEFYQLVRQMLLEGQSFEEVYENLMIDRESVESDAMSSTTVRSLMERIMERLKAENLIDTSTELPDETPKMQMMDQGMKPDYKVASLKLTGLVKRAYEARVLRQALSDTSQELGHKQAEYMELIKK